MPTIYHVPTAILLLLGGLLACFAGYRLFRVVLGVYGFILGALFATSVVAPASTQTTIIAALVGGAVGAIVLTLGYFVGVALLGAGLGAMVAHVIWAQSGWGDPTVLPVLVFAVVGAVIAVFVQRFAIIIGTAFAGSWTALVGGLALLAGRAGIHAADPTNPWALYPFNPTQRGWMTIAWLVIGVAGIVVQVRGKK